MYRDILFFSVYYHAKIALGSLMIDLMINSEDIRTNSLQLFPFDAALLMMRAPHKLQAKQLFSKLYISYVTPKTLSTGKQRGLSLLKMCKKLFFWHVWKTVLPKSLYNRPKSHLAWISTTKKTLEPQEIFITKTFSEKKKKKVFNFN